MTGAHGLGAAIDRDLATMTALARRIDEGLRTPAPPATPDATTPATPADGAAPRMHGPRVSVSRSSGMVGSGAPARQRAHLDDLVRRYTARTRASKELAARHRPVLADSRAVVGFRGGTKEMLYPLAARSARGAYLEDIDGNRYTDITMGFGVLLFGHEPEFVTEAVRAHLAHGVRLGPRSPETGEAAELLAEITGMERVAFAGSGTEANSGALRLARAATGRDLVVVFNGAYHGHADNVLGRSSPDPADRTTVPVSPGIPRAAVSDLLVLDYGSPDALTAIGHLADRIAAVVVEPVQSRHPALRPVDFVRRLRDLTTRHGIVLMFDEMLTGFRPAPRGAQELYGVVPDLATYGKLLGGGFPIGAIAGRADIMDGVDGGMWQYGDASHPRADTTFFGGTYIQHPVSMAAAKAVLTHLKERGPGLQRELNARTDRLAAELNGFFEAEEFPLSLAHFGSMFRLEHRADMELLYHHLVLRGVHVWEWRNFFLSTAHTDDDVDTVADAVKGSLRELRDAAFFPGGRPAPAATAPAPAATPATARPRPEAAPAATPGDRTAAAEAPAITPAGVPDFSICFFGDYPHTASAEDGYRLLLETARFADERGFHALWMPERHFHSFGGLFPNPSVLAAALARETSRIRLNSGSVVLPLHDPVRVAEEWSMVDGLSGGRVGIGCASGWNADDFVFFPDRYGSHRDTMYEQLAEVRRLWRGEAVTRRTGDGERGVRLFPRPVQQEPPMCAAVVGNPRSYEQAARHDLGVLTNLMAQSVEQLAENIARYRAARAACGLDPAAGRVSVLLHTYLADDHATAREQAYDPLARYMRASLSLFGGVSNSLGHQVDLDALTPDDLDVLFGRAYDRYCDQRSLIGTPASVAPVVDAVCAAGADEIVSLVDFGVPPDLLRQGLTRLDTLRADYRRRNDAAGPAPERVALRPAPREDAGTDAAPADGGPGAPVPAAQRGVWFLDRMLPGRPTYNEVKAVRLTGPLDVAALRTALDALVARHENLRTVFVDHDSEPRQVQLPPSAADFAVLDRGGQDEERAVGELLAEESARRFDLAKGPLFLTRLLRLAEEHHVLVFSMHHIVVDAESAAVIARDLSALYREAHDGTPAGLPRLEPGHARAAAVTCGAAADDLAYWREVLGGELPVLELPRDRPRPEIMSGHGRALFRTLGPDLSEALRELSRRRRVTLFMTLLAGYAVALREASGQDDLVIGTAVSDRPEGARDLVGFFVNTVALRCDLSGGPTFAGLLDRLRRLALDAYDHARVPFVDVVGELRPQRRTDRTPVYQVLAEFESGDPFRFELPGVTAVPLPHGPDKSVADLAVYFTDRPEGVRCHLEYATDLFDEDTAEAFHTSLRDVLAAAVRDPDTPIDLLAAGPGTAAGTRPWPPAADGAPTAAPTPDPAATDPATVVDLIARHAAAHPSRPAVVHGGTTLAYGELADRSARLAAVLRAHAPAGGLVAVALPRSADLVVAQLAVARAGCVHVPLDPALGPAHARRVLADCGAEVVVTGGPADAWTADAWTAADGPTPVDVTAPAAPAAPPADAAAAPDDAAGPYPAGPADPCYVIHTSGTTGEPHGVVVTHANLLHLCRWAHRRFGLGPGDRGALVCSPAFDASVLEIWPALTAGACLAVPEEAARLDPAALAAWYTEAGVTFSMLPTALGEALLALEPGRGPTGLRHLLIGGDVLRRRPRPGTPYTVWNVYGPTEATVLCTLAEVDPAPDGVGAPVPIGHAVDGARLLVADPDSGRPVPDGGIGELLVGGPGVAAGYLGRPEETAARFVSDGSGGRLYRTGDLVRRGADGALEFHGRLDDQVKIRGYRVEPETVTRALLALDGVRQAAVTSRRDRYGNAYLAAHVVPSDAGTTAAQLTAALAERLPDHLVPRAWSLLERLPVTVNGKLDRAALPAAGTAPDAAAEERVRALWAAEFGTDPELIGPDAAFFDLGGHSVTAIRLLNRVRAAFGTDYPMVRFYQDPTVSGMVAWLSGTGGSSADRPDGPREPAEPSAEDAPGGAVSREPGREVGAL